MSNIGGVIKSIRDGRRKSMSAFVSEAILQFFPSTDEKKEQKEEREEKEA